MSAARERILARLRSAASGADAIPDLARRASPLPDWVRDPAGRFVDRARTAQAEVMAVDSRAHAVATILDTLEQVGCDGPVAGAPHPLVEGLLWTGQPRLALRNAEPEDAACVTAAYAGIAETGSLVLLSGPQSPTRMNFLPDLFFCLLPRSRIVPRQEDLWQQLRREPRGMPRCVNLITGPSRTADVEQTIQLGAHGPRRVQILLLPE